MKVSDSFSLMEEGIQGQGDQRLQLSGGNQKPGIKPTVTQSQHEAASWKAKWIYSPGETISRLPFCLCRSEFCSANASPHAELFEGWRADFREGIKALCIKMLISNKTLLVLLYVDDGREFCAILLCPLGSSVTQSKMWNPLSGH